MRSSLYRLIFLLIGVTLILSGISLLVFFPTQGTPPNALQLAHVLFINCGVAVGTIALVDYIWGILGGEPLSAEIKRLASLNNLLADSTKTGLTRVYPKVQIAPNPRWEALIESSKANIDLCGYQLLDLVDSQAILSTIVKKAAAGIEVRVVLHDPDNSPALDMAASATNLDAMRANMRHALARFVDANSSLPEGKHIRLVTVSPDQVMDAAIRRFDDVMYVVHYLHSVNTPDTPLFVFRREATPDCMFYTYLHWFDGILQRGKAQNRVKAISETNT